MKIVTNGHGLYAIRWGIWPFYSFFDLKTPGFWWSKGNTYYIHCWEKKEKVEHWFGLLNPKVAVTILNDKENRK